jgi:hypothetical protein
MSSEEESMIAALFSKEVKHAPSVEIVANDMARGLCTYHVAFKALRNSAMNYETLPEYKTHNYIMSVPKDQLWPYTPHFRKFLGLAIQELFQTQIAYLSFSAATIEQTVIYVDDHKNRWVMGVQESSADPTLNQIIMYFPLSNTQLGCSSKIISIEHLLDMDYLIKNGLGLKTEDVALRWFGRKAQGETDLNSAK